MASYRRAAPRCLRAIASALALLLCAATAARAAADDVRVAVVIGNAAYPAAPLANTANDADAVGGVLRSMGFQVVAVQDGSREQMIDAIQEASSALKGHHGVGMLYYAGHGLQLDWHNYMVPVDVTLTTPGRVASQTVDVQSVLDAFRDAGNRINIVVLDACRDNPFGPTSSAKGLAPMDAPAGSLLAFATAPGNVADDGSEQSGNGLYTHHLVQELKTPKASLEDVFKRVRLLVRQESQGRQVPWESTSLEDEFYFDPSVRQPSASESDGALTAPELAELERQRREWLAIRESTTPAPIFAFLQRYPSGPMAEQAEFRLDQLQRTAVQPQAGQDVPPALPSGVNRYAIGDVLVHDFIDGYTKHAVRKTSTVTFADDLHVEMNGGKGILDQMGGVILSPSGRKSPAVLTTPADLAVGKHWHATFTNTAPSGEVHPNYFDFKVVALEDIDVPAGHFKAYKIERKGESRRANGLVFMSGTSWVDPATMIELRRDTMNRRNGVVRAYESIVLVSMKRAPRADGR